MAASPGPKATANDAVRSARQALLQNRRGGEARRGEALRPALLGDRILDPAPGQDPLPPPPLPPQGRGDPSRDPPPPLHRTLHDRGGQAAAPRDGPPDGGGRRPRRRSPRRGPRRDPRPLPPPR